MNRIAIYGAGGFGRETKGLLDEMGLESSFAGFLDDFKTDLRIATAGSYDDVLIAIADPHIRQKLVSKLKHEKFLFETLIHKDVFIHSSVLVGRGSIICSGTRLTVDINVGEFVIINLNSTIGHDVIIGDCCSIMPSVNISGNVTIGTGVLIGSGATILQGLNIGNDAIIGAGAVVTRSVEPGKTVVGIPARIM